MWELLILIQPSVAWNQKIKEFSKNGRDECYGSVSIGEAHVISVVERSPRTRSALGSIPKPRQTKGVIKWYRMLPC